MIFVAFILLRGSRLTQSKTLIEFPKKRLTAASALKTIARNPSEKGRLFNYNLSRPEIFKYIRSGANESVNIFFFQLAKVEKEEVENVCNSFSLLVFNCV